MRDMFDEFMEELRRRQAEQRRKNGEPGPQDAADGGEGPGNEGHVDQGHGGEPHEPGRTEPVGRYGRGDDGPDDEGPGRGYRGFGDGRGFGGRFGREGSGDEFHFSFGRGRTILVVAIVVTIFVVLALGASLIGLITDGIWYQSVGFSNVFWTRLESQLGYFLAGALIAAIVLWLNIWLAGRLGPLGQRSRFSLDEMLQRILEPDGYAGPRIVRRGGPSNTLDMPAIQRPVAIGLAVIAAFVALTLGGLLAGSWETVQLWLHRVPFGTNDAVFGRDIGFFVFELPFFRLLQSYAASLVLVSLALASIRYLIAALSGTSLRTPARLHLGVLAGLLLVLFAAGYQLDKLELVYSSHAGVFTGVSYTDANARFFALDALTVIAAFAGAFLIGFAYTRWLVPLAGTVLVWVLAIILLTTAFPFAIQRFVVEPNQQNEESPYISNNIHLTRQAFGLDTWQSSQYTPQTNLTAAALASEQATLQNARLWDYRPLQTTLDGLQVIRQYYNFNDLDTDRYVFSDAASCAPQAAPCLRQVWLAGREIDYSKLDPSWVNQHLIYTHGIGATMVPVNEVVATGSGGGQPKLIIQNLPPSSNSGAPAISRPQIYFGTQSSNWVIADSASQEFDYPSSSSAGSDTYTRWAGQTGITLGNALTRLLFGLRLGDLNLLISDQVNGSSQLLINRNIKDRTELVAPFLRFDKDPYLVVTPDGKLVYIQDAYTTTDRYPGAESYDPGSDSLANGLAGDSFNYVRNSVKIVMDAYDGSMTFYVADPADPLIRAWQGVFGGMFHPIDEMPAGIRAHLRYPEDLFNAQTTMFERYHVTDPGVFYQRNDVWEVPQNGSTTTTTSGSGANAPSQLPLEAYYVVMRLPDQNPEFMLLQPMVPQKRPNMISWVAARNDPAHYGQVIAFDFPRDSSIFGPSQMEGLFAQNKDISQQITLWSQQGSQVILGNLLVIPLQSSILYVEPVYLESTQNPLPVFQKVIVATPNQIVWGNTLQDAVNQILAGAGAAPSPGTSPSPGPSASPSPTVSATPGSSGTPLPTNVQQIVAQANEHYAKAQAALANGDFATYGAEIKIVHDLLQQLQSVVGTPAPSP